MPRPDLSRVPAWYHGYINLVKENDLVKALEAQSPVFIKFLKKIPEQKRNYRSCGRKRRSKKESKPVVERTGT